MKLLLDMNLSPDWAAYFGANGLTAVHWSTVGAPSSPDSEIMEWALERGFVIVTHDLDFGALLAVAGATGPSVVQIRMQDILPDQAGPWLIQAIRAAETYLELGALVSVDPLQHRIRLLPLRPARA